MDPMYQILDGRKISAEIKQEIAREVVEMEKKTGRRPHLSAILVGHDGGPFFFWTHNYIICL